MKKFIISFTTVFLLFGCTNLNDELYDTIPADKFPENQAQAALMVVPAYKAMQQFVDWSGWWFAQEITSDEVTCPTRLTDWDDGGKWRVLHEHTWDNKTEAITGMWGVFYGGITEANKAIESLLPGQENADIATMIAQMRTLRDYYYYLLIDNYGDVPYVTSFSNAPEQPEKMDRAAIYDSLVTELESNISLLPNSSSKTIVTKGTGYSLLAKLYLNAEVYTGGTSEWVKAEDACDSIIALGLYSLESEPLAPFITENENSTENIFTIPYDEDDYTGFNLHMRTLHYNSNLTFNMTVGPWNGFAVMEDFYNTYQANDKRKEGFLVGQQYSYTNEIITDAGANDADLVFNPHIPALNMDNTYSLEEIRMSGARVAKFEIKLGAKADLSNDFPIFRYADILLMKAEAMIRQGENGDSYVNQIRERAGLSAWSGVGLDSLLAERGREMFWEAKRRQDLIRFGKFNDAWWEKSASSSDRNIFPIPQWVIDSNPNLAK